MTGICHCNFQKCRTKGVEIMKDPGNEVGAVSAILISEQISFRLSGH